jgi:nitric oxide reductase activation protein
LLVYDWATGDRSLPNSYDENGKYTLSRRASLRIRVLKDFQSSYVSRRTLNNLAASGGGGSTPTGEGLAFGCERIAARPEFKKILFLLTDGVPDYGTGHHEYITDVLGEAKRQGLIVCVLGMDAYDTRGVFGEHWFHVHTASDFIRITTGTLVNVIRNWRP